MSHASRLRVAATAVALLVARAASAVVGGATTTAYPAVVELLDADRNPYCNGVLIGPSCVLTSANCAKFLQAHQIAVFFGNDLAQPNPYLVNVRKVLFDPAHDPFFGGAEEAVLQLVTVPAGGIAPMSRAADVGDPSGNLTVVGFGSDDPDVTTLGPKRVATDSPFLWLQDLNLLAFGTTSSGPCNGDAGAPVMRDTGSGLQIIGVTTDPDPACDGAYAQRTDAVASFIDSAVLGCTATRVADGIQDDGFESGSEASMWIPSKPKSIAVTPVDPTLKGYAGFFDYDGQFTATGTYSDGSTADLTSSVTWSSSDTGVATISNAAGSQGKAFAQSSGSTTISAQLGALGDSTTLTVTGPFLRSNPNTFRTFASINSSGGLVPPASCAAGSNMSCHAIDGEDDTVGAAYAWSSGNGAFQPWLQVDSGDMNWGKHIDHVWIDVDASNCPLAPSDHKLYLSYLPNGSNTWTALGTIDCSVDSFPVEDILVDKDAWGFSISGPAGTMKLIVYEIEFWTSN